MGLINCPECKQEISDRAGSCPNCGYPLGHPTSDSDFKASRPRVKRKPDKSSIGCLGWTGIIAVAFILLVAIFGGNGGSSGPYNSSGTNYDEPEYDDIGAWIVTEKFVKRRLKSPSTAEFPSMTDADITQTGKKFEISSYVDAQNSFGAQIRKDFNITVEYAGGGNWNLIDLEFE